LTDHQLDFCKGYLNKHHGDLLQAWAQAFSNIGTEMAKANVCSGGSFVIQSAVLIHVDIETIKLQVTCQIRGQEDRDRRVQFGCGSRRRTATLLQGFASRERECESASSNTAIRLAITH
jgi:hypothetical protein